MGPRNNGDRESPPGWTLRLRSGAVTFLMSSAAVTGLTFHRQYCYDAVILRKCRPSQREGLPTKDLCMAGLPATLFPSSKGKNHGEVGCGRLWDPREKCIGPSLRSGYCGFGYADNGSRNCRPWGRDAPTTAAGTAALQKVTAAQGRLTRRLSIHHGNWY